MAKLHPGALIQRAAHGLFANCVLLLRARREKIVGARVVLLVGSGGNGGDTLWAGARLAARGASVTAFTLADRWHTEAAAALVHSGGRLRRADALGKLETVANADLILDGIVGIGGKGALRSPVAELVTAAVASNALVVAVDLPSGIDADTGAVADPAAVVTADVTVTFGCLELFNTSRTNPSLKCFTYWAPDGFK